MPSDQQRHPSRSFLFWLIVSNAVIRGAWLVYMHPPQSADFDWYFQHAVGMADGQGYVWGHHYTAYWPIGWPFVLSLLIRLFGPHVTAGLVLNALLGIGIVVLVYLAALRIFSSQRPAMAAAIGYTLLPSQIMWNAVLGSEELFTFLLMLSIFLYLRTTNGPHSVWLKPVVLSGLVLGFACDVRPIALLFPAFILCYELWVQHRGFGSSVRRAATFAVSMFVSILPVTLRNLATMHHFVLVSTNGGVNLWQGLNTDDGYYWTWDASKNPLLQAGSNEVLENQIGQHTATQYFLQHPILTLQHGWLKIVGLYHVDNNAVWYTLHAVGNPVAWVWDYASTYAYYAFMALFLIGLVGLLVTRRNAKSALFPLLFALYNTLLFLFFPAWDRFRFPLMPIFAIFLGYGFVWLYGIFKTQRMSDTA